MKPTKDEKALLYHLIGYDIVGIAFVKLLALSYYVVVLSPQYGENTASFVSFFFAEFVVKVFCYLFLWKFKKKSINHFL